MLLVAVQTPLLPTNSTTKIGSFLSVCFAPSDDCRRELVVSLQFLFQILERLFLANDQEVIDVQDQINSSTRIPEDPWSSFGLSVPEFSQSSTHVLCPELGSITRPVQRSYRRAIRRGFSEAGSSLGISMKSGLSLNPYKKAAVTSKSITLNFFPDDLGVAALEIKLLAIDSPGVPEKRVSRVDGVACKFRSNKARIWFGTLYRSLVRDDPFGRQHHGLWIEFCLAPVHHFIHASLREFLQLDLLCFRDLVFR